VTVKITYINLVVHSKAILDLKSTRKLISEINVRLLDRSQVFLLGKTVGSCTDAPAGPKRAFSGGSVGGPRRKNSQGVHKQERDEVHTGGAASAA
jgi:hypothetical protein